VWCHFLIRIPSPVCRHTTRNDILLSPSDKNVAPTPRKKNKSLSAPFAMTSLASAIGCTAGVVPPDQKLLDLMGVTVDPQKGHPSGGMTTMHGMHLANTETWYDPLPSYPTGLGLTSGVRLKATDPEGTGPALLEDQVAMEKIHRFDHERIPERIVHARGAGAHGRFRVLDDRASKYTFAPVLTDTSRVTPLFVRFSTVQGPRGSADTVRDVRGFATKFYTPEGNWDIVG